MRRTATASSPSSPGCTSTLSALAICSGRSSAVRAICSSGWRGWRPSCARRCRSSSIACPRGRRCRRLSPSLCPPRVDAAAEVLRARAVGAAGVAGALAAWAARAARATGGAHAAGALVAPGDAAEQQRRWLAQTPTRMTLIRKSAARRERNRRPLGVPALQPALLADARRHRLPMLRPARAAVMRSSAGPSAAAALQIAGGPCARTRRRSSQKPPQSQSRLGLRRLARLQLRMGANAKRHTTTLGQQQHQRRHASWFWTRAVTAR